MASMRPLVIAAGVALGLSSVARADDASTTQDLAAQVKALQAKVASLEGQSAANRADVSATIDSVLKDADARSKSMALSGGMAGYDDTKGFVIQSANGDFLLHPYLQMQARYAANYTRHGKADGNDTTDDGFELRRMKLGFDGTVFGNIDYRFQWATNRHTGLVSLEDGWAKLPIADQLSLRVGQFKDPFAHESLTSSMKQLAVERSYLGAIFAFDDNYVQGVSLVWDGGAFHGELAYTDGEQSNNTNFQSNNGDPTITGPNFGVAGRLDYKVFGDWKSYDDFTALGNAHDLLVIGGGFDFTQTGRQDVIRHTVDAQWETGPLALYGSYLARYIVNGPNGDSYDPGVLVQAGYMLNNQWEVFGRYDLIHFDKKTAPGTLRNVHELTAGVNYYVHKHNVKVTVDATWLPKGAPVADDLGDILKNDSKNEIVFRAQLQLFI